MRPAEEIARLVLFAWDRRQSPPEPNHGARMQALAFAKMRNKRHVRIFANPDRVPEITQSTSVPRRGWPFSLQTAEVVPQFQQQFAPITVVHVHVGGQEVDDVSMVAGRPDQMS